MPNIQTGFKKAVNNYYEKEVTPEEVENITMLSIIMEASKEFKEWLRKPTYTLQAF